MLVQQIITMRQDMLQVQKLDSKLEALYGVGVKYSTTDAIDFGLSYEISNLNVKDPLNNTVKFDLKYLD